VDNGIASMEGVAHAKALGLQVLVTDHHLPGPDGTVPTARGRRHRQPQPARLRL
jgi:single-stranded-DNA-specific exonuclease